MQTYNSSFNNSPNRRTESFWIGEEELNFLDNYAENRSKALRDLIKEEKEEREDRDPSYTMTREDLITHESFFPIKQSEEKAYCSHCKAGIQLDACRKYARIKNSQFLICPRCLNRVFIERGEE
ncbi:MAG: hypothetical protein R6V35_03660 [Candidatus Nanohaloarchaea archaeon]